MVTIKEVAEVAGVSASTVSRVLNGKTYVNESTRNIVMEAVRKTNYSPNVLAQSLKIGRSNTICLMVPSIENLIFPEIAKGVEDFARRSGFTVILCNTEEDIQVETSYIDKMKTRLVDGFVMCAAMPNSDYIRQLYDQGMPVVLVNRFEEKDIGRIDTVAVDNYRAAYEATEYMIRSGRKRIALALGRWELYLYRERYRGYRKALEDNGIPYDDALVIEEMAGSGSNSFFYATQELMCLSEPPDAFFCTSDPKAFFVMRALHEIGIRIPQDVWVLGFDNVFLSALTEPPLSTISQRLHEIGKVAANRLIQQINYKEKTGELPPPTSTMLDWDLIIRRSTG